MNSAYSAALSIQYIRDICGLQKKCRYKCMLDRIIFMPSGSPPLKTSDLAEAVHREAMTRLAISANGKFRYFGYRDAGW